MTVDVPSWAAEAARELPYPLVFATVSGGHRYGFASVDSDLDLRACHLLPAAEVLGLVRGPGTPAPSPSAVAALHDPVVESRPATV